MARRLLRAWRSEDLLPPQDESDLDRRLDTRHDFTGYDVRMLFGGMPFVLRLKDLSCTGVCALTDAPVAPGEVVTVMFEERGAAAAQVRWVRKALIGAAFLDPLTPEQLHKIRLKARNCKRRG